MLYRFLMKDTGHPIVFALLYSLCTLIPIVSLVYIQGLLLKVIITGLCLFSALWILHKLPEKRFERKHLTILYRGCLSLKVFVLSFSLSVVALAFFFTLYSVTWQTIVMGILWLALLEVILFWNGMIRVFLTSVQLGLKWRVLAVICGWIPLANAIMLLKMIRIIEKELTFEYQKDLLCEVQMESSQCETKYPLLFVHGVFFRDIKYLNYWGRIPRFLQQRGAKILYGNQESAQSVDYSGKQLAERIEVILAETGCEKVNIIAHSKGGLDSRCAISKYGMDRYVASLTTINTPHKGCIFANYLLQKAPQKMVAQIEKMYNAAFRKLGDQNPDFYTAVKNLSDETCLALNKEMLNKEGVYYQSIATFVNKAMSGKFPLNLFYPIVKHFDGKNDGLVSVESASFFENTIVVEPKGKRGISHADVIDLNRENFSGFDVREFYKELVVDLKTKGF